jgi:hypothetical protein
MEGEKRARKMKDRKNGANNQGAREREKANAAA